MTAFEDFVNTELPYRVSIAVSPGTTGLPKFTGTGKVTELIKCNYAAGGDPGATNDSTEGYSVGSLWHDTTGNHAWICLDATEDAAVWKQLDAAGVTDHGALAGLDDNDHGAIYYTEAEVNALLHAESHSVTSHSDVTDATGTQLEELTGGGATTLHSHAGGGSGDVVGPSAVTDDSIVGFDGTTGKLIRELPVTITTAGGIHTFKPAESLA